MFIKKKNLSVEMAVLEFVVQNRLLKRKEKEKKQVMCCLKIENE